MPNVGEYDKETLLSYEKEVLGIYLSGHPLEQYRDVMEKLFLPEQQTFSQKRKAALPGSQMDRK